MLSFLNNHKHLSAKEFDALLGAVLKKRADAHRAAIPKRAPRKKVVEKKK